MKYRYVPTIQTGPRAPRECLLTAGPVRAIMDHKKGNILIETDAEHPAGKGICICRLPKGNMAEARAIVAHSDLLRAARPFAALGRSVEGHDPKDPLFVHAAVKLEITAGDAQAIRAAHDRAISPVDMFQSAARYILAKEPRAAHKP